MSKLISRGLNQDMHYLFLDNVDEIFNKAVEAYLRSIDQVGPDNTILVCPMRKNEKGLTVNSFNTEIQYKIILRYILENYKGIDKKRWMVKGVVVEEAEGAYRQRIEKFITDTLRHMILQRGERRFFIKDKIIQRQNDYSGKGVVNGEMGYITQIKADRSFMVTFDDKEVPYLADEISQIELAYAISGHSYQGSQAKRMIVVIHSSHYILLSKQWLYTAMTRGIEHTFIIANKEAFNMAVSRSHGNRTTFLQHIIKEQSK